MIALNVSMVIIYMLIQIQVENHVEHARMKIVNYVRLIRFVQNAKKASFSILYQNAFLVSLLVQFAVEQMEKSVVLVKKDTI